MITVKEYSFEQAKAYTDAFNVPLSPEERVLLMDEGGEIIGASVIGLDRTVVEIRHIFVKDRPFPYYDLLARSTLNLINLFELPIMVRVQPSDYFLPFGFIKNEDGFMYVQSDKITFKGSLCGGR